MNLDIRHHFIHVFVAYIILGIYSKVVRLCACGALV